MFLKKLINCIVVMLLWFSNLAAACTAGKRHIACFPARALHGLWNSLYGGLIGFIFCRFGETIILVRVVDYSLARRLLL
jgi:hypothetical protein